MCLAHSRRSRVLIDNVFSEGSTENFITFYEV